MNKLTRTIQAPGIEINEIDISQYGIRYDFSDLTMVMLNGFADRGENYLTDIVTSVKQFTDKFGKPTNEAERYLYNAVKETIRGGGIGVVTKLPYQNNSLEKYTYTKYKVKDGTKPINNYSIENQVSSVTNLSNAIFNQISGNNNLVSITKFHDYIFDLCGFDSMGHDISKLAEDKFGTSAFYENALSIIGNTSATGTEADIRNILSSNGLSASEMVSSMYLSHLDLDDVKEIADNAGLSGMDTFISNAAYCNLNTLSDSLTSFAEIEQDYSLSNNYMDYDTYDDLIIGNNQFLSDGEIVIVDVSRTKYEKDRRIEDTENKISGEYIGLLPVVVSPVNAMLVQGIINQDKTGFISNYNLVDKIIPIHRNNLSGTDDFDKMVDVINNKDVKFEVFSQLIKSENPGDNTLGQTAASYFPALEFTDSGKLDDTFLKQIGIVVFKMYIDPADFNRVNFVPVESYVGSLDKSAKDSLTGRTTYIENMVNQYSENIRVFAKFNFLDNGKSYTKASTYLVKNQSARSLGFYESDFDKKISVALLEKSLDIVFQKLANPNMLKLDLLADAGISNIAQNIHMLTKGSSSDNGYYNVDENFNYRILNRFSLREWQRIIDKYTNFCEHTRRDLMFLADSPRNLALQGAYKLISRRTTIDRTVKKDILPSIKFMSNINTSYGAGYVTWLLAVDDTTKDYIWLPPSIKALEAYLNADTEYDFWSAPAGLRRGRMSRVYDVAFNPTEIDAETIYTNRWNYNVSYPLDGIILEGQKTFQKEKTAFDRVNVRRLFIRIEKDLKGVGRRFMYEQFTEANLTQFRDAISNYLSSVKSRGGIVDYNVICDGRNNTAETIDNNELHATIAIKPTKTIEFIVLNFICTNQSANVEEVASKYL